MKSFLNIFTLFFVISLLSNCSSAQKLQTKTPIEIGEVYFQKWNAGVKEGGSGIDLYIPVLAELPTNIQLDSVYFRGSAAKLQKLKDGSNVFVGRFKSDFIQKPDVVMSSDSKEEYGNKAPNINKKIPFDLKDSECALSYKEGRETKYFKIEKIIEKAKQNYPSNISNKHE